MSNHDENIKQIQGLVARIGDANFTSALNEINRRTDEAKKANCNHDWKLSQIAGDGYNCFKCRSWKPEDK